MHPQTILLIFAAYTLMLFVIAWITARNSNNETYFIGNKSSPWYVVAYGMIGASLSGVTFISIPGDVGNSYFSYMMIVLGYLIGYTVIAKVLLPLYYNLNLTSIYSYLEKRFGFWSYKTGAFFFILSRSIGASFRVYLVVNVLQMFVFDTWGIPFPVTVLLFMGLIILYSFKGGIKTIVWTDTLQTTFMLAAIIISIVLIAKNMEVSFTELYHSVANSKYSQMFIFEWADKRFFLKQFLSGAFIAIVMTGLDQDMMQKNLSCRNLRDAQKNVYLMSWSLVPVNLLFLFLGVVLYIFAASHGINIPARTDDLFPLIALRHLGPTAGVVFLIGLVAAAYSSADGAITSLTTSFSIDFLGLKKNEKLSDKRKMNIRYIVHFSIAMMLILLILVFRAISDQSVIQKLFTIAGYTYGPLLGLYAFGLFTKHLVKDRFVPLVAVLSPAVCYVLSTNSAQLLWGYRFGFELLILNGLLTFTGLLLLRKKQIQTLL
ncbi:MAG: sodium:solute symporter [Bacteroidales bacterium]|nr:sodium:solute symporter [Bacteroidales bacterium]MDZ4205564.1 sodium:solute symporter [Bacteroidales bacterium]